MHCSFETTSKITVVLPYGEHLKNSYEMKVCWELSVADKVFIQKWERRHHSVTSKVRLFRELISHVLQQKRYMAWRYYKNRSSLVLITASLATQLVMPFFASNPSTYTNGCTVSDVVHARSCVLSLRRSYGRPNSRQPFKNSGDICFAWKLMFARPLQQSTQSSLGSAGRVARARASRPRGPVPAFGQFLERTLASTQRRN